MKLGPFEIDEVNSDERYLYVDIRSLTVAIKADDDGVAVDIFPRIVADAPVASTWATWGEGYEDD